MQHINEQPRGCNSHPNVNADFLLASMRAGSLRYKLVASEIDAIGVALKSGLYTVDDALAELNALGILAYLPVPNQQAAA